jgi:hypothetical protein
MKPSFFVRAFDGLEPSDYANDFSNTTLVSTLDLEAISAVQFLYRVFFYQPCFCIIPLAAAIEFAHPGRRTAGDENHIAGYD